MSIFSISESQIQSVSSFQDLVSTPFQGITNALCWQRELVGDFEEIVNLLASEENITTIEPEALLALPLSEKGNLARKILLEDMQTLQEYGALPVLNVIKFYDRDEELPFLSTDVYSYHVDSSPIPTDTFLCTYYGASSEILPNAQCVKKVLIPEIRAALRELYDGPEEGFESFLSEYCFNLHYQAKPDAQPISTGLGHLWRLAVEYPESSVLPCVHRAPIEEPGQHRLLLIC